MKCSAPPTEKQKYAAQKWAKGLNRHVSKENIPMPKRQMKIYSTSLMIEEMQMEITVGHSSRLWAQCLQGKSRALVPSRLTHHLMGRQRGSLTRRKVMVSHPGRG